MHLKNLSKVYTLANKIKEAREALVLLEDESVFDEAEVYIRLEEGTQSFIIEHGDLRSHFASVIKNSFEELKELGVHGNVES